MNLPPERLDQIVLAVLFASEESLSARKLANIVEEDTSPDDIKASVNRLTEFLVENVPSIRLERVAGGFQVVTNTDFAEYIARLYSGRRKQRLSKAAMETLAIIAYKQPITRADMENIRGVGCGGVITTLMERTLIRIVGKARVLGAPFLYGTTQEFLEYLGLNSIKDLPSMEELEELIAREVASEENVADEEGGEAPNDEGGEGSAKLEAFEWQQGRRDSEQGDDEQPSAASEEADEEHERETTAAPESAALSDTDASGVSEDKG